MRCSKCGTESSPGKRFCSKCGSWLPIRCPNCGADSPPNVNFCADCGAPMQASVSVSRHVPEPPAVMHNVAGRPVDANNLPESERKNITALFADIKGSTELMRELDPEEARAIVDPVLQLMMEAVHRYDGYVVQSTGDGIFAMFGAPVAHEDHPQRALHAALAMQQALRSRGEHFADQAGDGLKPVPVEARIGVNTGEVVLRIVNTGGHTEYSPVGHVANLAARMQTIAPPGSIVIAEECRRLVEGYFSLRALGPTEIKGVGEAVNVYEVVGSGPLRDHFELAAQRGLTRFVGREHEVAELQRALELATTGRGHIVAVVADAGTGKSRLFYQFKASIPIECKLLEAYSVSHGKASAWLPVLELLRGYFGIADSDDAASRRETVRVSLTALDPALEDALPYVLSLLGIVEGADPLAQMDPQIKRHRTLEAITRILLREAVKQAVIVIFEDLHWIDHETQAFLDVLTDRVANTRILLLVNYRPEYHHDWGNKSCYLQLRLDALDQQSTDQMLTALLSDNAELSPLKRVITERTGGNPFFIEEMVQALFDDGTLARNGVVRVAHPLSQLRLPPTVQGILASRMDRLPAVHKQLLQTLAVIGRESPVAIIRQLYPQPEERLDGMLAHLRSGEFIYEQPAASGVEYVFKHALTQEVAYNSVLMAQRKLLHESAGAAIEQIYAERLDDHLTELARHYTVGDNVPKAIEYLDRSAQQAIQRSANIDALNSLETALRLLQKLPEGAERQRRELLLRLARGSALIPMEGWSAPKVEQNYSRALELCQQLGDSAELFPASFGLWAVYHVKGEFPDARRIAELLLKRTVDGADRSLSLLAGYALGETLFHMGELSLARDHLEAANALYQFELDHVIAFRLGGVDPRVNCLSYGAWVLWHMGYPDQALIRANESLAHAQRLQHPHSLIFATFILAVVHEYRRESCLGQKLAEQVMTLSAEHGFTFWSAFSSLHHGYLIAEQGRREGGLAQVRDGITASRAIGAELGRPMNINQVAQICLETGRVQEGLQTLADAFVAAEQREDRTYEPESHRLKGELLLKQDQSKAAEAQACFERAIALARKQAAKSWELRATMSLARLLAQRGRRDEARAMLAEIYNWFTEGFDTADLKDAKKLLHELNS